MDLCKCVVVGDGSVGKTCLLVSYTTNRFPTEYVPTVFDNYNAHLMLNKRCVNLGLWDTAGQDDYDRLRPLSYPQTDVFVAVFSIISPTSFRNVKTKWIPELKHYMPNVPIVLVGAKADMRGNEAVEKQLAMLGEHMVTEEEGQKLAEEVGAAQYIEASALTQNNLHHLFECATTEALLAKRGSKTKKPAKQCVIL